MRFIAIAPRVSLTLLSFLGWAFHVATPQLSRRQRRRRPGRLSKKRSAAKVRCSRVTFSSSRFTQRPSVTVGSVALKPALALGGLGCL